MVLKPKTPIIWLEPERKLSRPEVCMQEALFSASPEITPDTKAVIGYENHKLCPLSKR